jgi:hypothetical protein
MTTEYTTYENTHNPHITIHFSNAPRTKSRSVNIASVSETGP